MSSSLTSGGVLRLGVVLVVVLAVVGGGVAYFTGGFGHHAEAGSNKHEEQFEEPSIRVNVVHPRYDKEFTVTERRPADVVAYYRDDLDSRVAGEIVWIETAPGDVVKKGETLIKIYVPELEARVKEEEAALKRSEAQVVQKEASVTVAVADHEAVEAKIDAMKAKLKSDQAYEKFRSKQYDRYAALYEKGAIDARLVDEQEDRFVAARETVISAQQAVTAAVAEEKASKARIDQAKADLKEAKEKVNVTEAELSHAKALKEFATIYAPFDGVIVKRDQHANVGAIVQKADEGHPNPLLVIERQDIVTILMSLPDVYAAYITPKTEAIFETPTLPGVKIRGRVTRFPPSLVTPQKTRTMLVEVDLWNRSPEEFEKVKNDPKFLKSLKNGLPGDATAAPSGKAAKAGGDASKKEQANEFKGALPRVPKFEGKLTGGQQLKLMPGMFGDLTLILKKFENVHMIPSSAIISRGGYKYIYLVKDGKAHLQPVRVQIDDGKLAKVDKLSNDGEILGSLTDQDEVIISNQAELFEDQPVEPELIKDWSKVTPGGDDHEKH